MVARDIRQLAREASLVGGWLMVLLVLLSLITYSPHDPGWSTASGKLPEVDIQNHLGVVGAYLADVLLAAFGYSAYLLCAAAVAAMHALFRGESAKSGRLGVHWCAFGVLCFIVASAGLEYVHFADAVGRGVLPSGAGGGVGKAAGGGMQKIFGVTGASILLLGVWMISFSLSAALSWFAVFEIIGEYCERVLAGVGGSMARQWAMWQLARAQKAKEKKEQMLHPPVPTKEFIVSAARKLAARKIPPAKRRKPRNYR